MTVDELIAVTNFVKFSTAEDAASSSIPASWWSQCAARYVKFETELLEPDLVIGFGGRTVRELGLVLDALDGRKPTVLSCRFPGRIASVKARPLTTSEATIWEGSILPLASRLKPPPSDSYHAWRMLQYPGYFCDIAKAWGIAV